VGRWLAAHGLPAVRPLTDLDQPVEVAGCPVTFWREIPPHRQGTISDVVRLLSRLHALPVPNLPLGRLDPFVRLPERIDAAGGVVTEAERTWLRRRVERLRRAWAELPPGLPLCVVHGDAWVGNIAVTETGEALLLDFERCSVGPPEWDLVSTAVKHTSFGTVSTEEYRKFATAYGHDVTTWAGYATMRAVRELRMATFALQHATAHPEAREQARYRVDCLLGRAGPRPWNWTAVG
jgi:aminoglycoside phosphotransferase (APT) family kinase protein